MLVAWETPRATPSLPYSVCEELEEFDWSQEFWSSVCPILYKISQVEEDIWYSTGTIQDLLYENALLQNVEFEWGSYSRPVQITPAIFGRDVKQPAIKTAKVVEVFEENTDDIDHVEYERCTVIHKSYQIERVEVRECQVEKNYIYKNTKYFCRTCSLDICNACFTTECSAHHLQWLGVATFNCYCPQHKSDPKCL